MSLNEAYIKMGAALATLWRDKATIYGVQPTQTERGMINQQVTLATNVPCKLSLGGLKSSEAGFYGTDSYDAKIYLATGVHIPAAAIIEVLDANGHTTRYKRASAGYTAYLSHQEIAVVRDEKAKESAGTANG